MMFVTLLIPSSNVGPQNDLFSPLQATSRKARQRREQTTKSSKAIFVILSVVVDHLKIYLHHLMHIYCENTVYN